MKKNVSYKHYLKYIYNLFKTRVVDVSSAVMSPKTTVYMNFDLRSFDCFCYPTSPGVARISLGGLFYKKYLDVPEDVTPKYVDSHGSEYVRLLKATYYHELAHIIFTPLSCKLIKEYKTPDYIPVLHRLFNILEDIFIERYAMSVVYPFTKKYFDYMESKVFTADSYKDYEDKDDGLTFLNFLLIKLRMGKKASVKNKFFDDNKKEILDYIDKFLSTKKPTPRVEVLIEFFEFLLSKGLTFPIMELPKDTLIGEGFGDAAGKSVPAVDTSDAPSDSEGREGAPSTHRETDPKAFSDEASDEDVTVDDTVIEASDTYSSDSDLDSKISDKDIDDFLTDTVGSADYSHNFVVVREHFNYTDKTLTLIEKYLDSVSPLSTACATKINVFKSRTRPRFNQGYSSGRLHVPSAIKGIPVNIFERKEDQGLQSDLAISLLLDNSGSMSGRRSEVCTKAALALTVAACKAGIPIEVNAFTADGDYTGCICYTYRLKRFQDTLDMCKPYMGIASSAINSTYSKKDKGLYYKELPTFAGNTDEINVFHVWKEFASCGHSDKLLIVISDGCTCGSTTNLTSVIKAIEESGIHVIGIGAESTSVKHSYSNYKVFNSIEELAELPAYFGDILLEFSKKKKR